MVVILWLIRDVSYSMVYFESKEKVTRRFMYLYLNLNFMKQARYVIIVKYFKYFKSVSLVEFLMVNVVIRNVNYFFIIYFYCIFN